MILAFVENMYHLRRRSDMSLALSVYIGWVVNGGFFLYIASSKLIEEQENEKLKDWVTAIGSAIFDFLFFDGYLISFSIFTMIVPFLFLFSPLIVMIFFAIIIRCKRTKGKGGNTAKTKADQW